MTRFQPGNCFYAYLFFSLLLLGTPVFLRAQITKIMGTVIDGETREPLPFVNICFKNAKSIGATSNFTGEYKIETRSPTDSLVASYIGYFVVTKPVLKNSFQVINFELFPDKITLPEVTVLPGENPAITILKKVLKNKDINNTGNFDALQYEAYTKIQIDINNVDDNFRKMRMLKPFKFIFENIDTSTVSGKSYLPIMISESVSEVFTRNNPYSHKEQIKASRMSGFNNDAIAQYMGDMYQKVNIYDNYILLFNKNFVSPVSGVGTIYYKYYLLDSLYLDNKWCYKIMFKPRRQRELTFTGTIWVNDTTYAVKQTDIQIAADANINYVRDLVSKQRYDRIDGKYWMLTEDVLMVDVNFLEDVVKTVGLYGKKTISYRNYVFNNIKESGFYSATSEVSVQDSSTARDNSYWEKARHDSLTKEEKKIYLMVDSVKKVPAYKLHEGIVKVTSTGYLTWGIIELGPYFHLYNHNQLEGSRFRIGGRTSKNLSKFFRINAYTAYGTKDEKFKYYGDFTAYFSKKPKRAASISYKHDKEQLGQYERSMREFDLLAAAFTRNPVDKLFFKQEAKAFYHHEWFDGFSNQLNFVYRDIEPLGTSIFNPPPLGNKNINDSLTSFDVRLDIHFAYHERFVKGEFDRLSLGTDYPVLDIFFTYGLKDILGSNYNYKKLQVTLRQKFYVGALGRSKFEIEAGKTWGTRLPYPLLKIHEGNETYSFSEYTFNLMNYYEFLSDRYVSLYYTHHFDGLLLNNIPLLRKLMLREVAFFKGVIGDLQDENNFYLAYPDRFSTLNTPYCEAGIGIENILKVLRVDAIWRLTHLNKPDIAKFGIRLTVQIVPL